MAAENFKVKKGLEVGTGITANSDGVNVTGIITATQFKGDGSGLTGVVGSGSGIVVKDEGSSVGTAGTVNFVGSGVAATLSAGTATVTINAGGLDNVVEDTTPQLGGNLDLNSKFVTGSGGINVTGVVTATTLKGAIEATTASFSGAIDANGDLDVDGQTEVDDLNVAGVSTFSNGINLSSGQLTVATSIKKASGTLDILADTIELSNAAANSTLAQFTNGAAAKLYFAGNQKLTTTINGIEVPDLNVTGVGTVGRLDTSGVTLGTNNNTFAAKFIDDAVANFGTDNDLKISHDDTHARITNTKGNIVVSGIISATSDVKVGSAITMDPTSGIITATSFSGSGASLTNLSSAQLTGALPALDGSALTGVTASGSGVVVKHDGSTVGTAGTINFSTNLDVSAISAGIVTVTASGGGGFSQDSQGNLVAGTNAGSSLDGSNAEYNILLGQGAGESIDGDDNNIAIGYDAGKNNTASSNIFMGRDAAKALSSSMSSQNIFIGHEAVSNKANISGTVVGAQAGIGNGTGINLTLFGYRTGGNSYNATTFIGHQAGRSATSACDFTTAVGAYALYNNAGTGNVAIGNDSGQQLTSGEFNTLAGYKAGRGNLSGTINYTDCVAIGSSAAMNLSSANNVIVIGANANPSSNTATNEITLGNANITKLRVPGIGLTFTSVGAEISGIVTATSFSGSGASLTSLDAGNLGVGTIPNGRFPATLPAVSGANLTALNASEITSGTLPIARIDDDAVTFAKMQNVGTGVLIGRNDSGTGDIETLSAADVRTLLNVADGATAGITTAAWTVGHSGASYYTFTGPGGLSNAQNADIHLVRGQTYQFIVNASGHGFGIQTVSGTWTGSNAYTTGITNAGAAVGTITFRVPYSAPARLYYACTSQHSGMVGNIFCRGAGGSDDKVGITTITGGFLHIKDNTSPAIRLQDNNNVNSDFKIYSPDGANHLRIYHENTSSDLVTIASGGNVGIGTDNPSTALEVKGDITVYNSNNQGDIFFGEHGDVADSKALIRMDQLSGTAGELQFHTESSGTLTKRLTIQSTGIVKAETSDSSGLTAHILVNNSESSAGVSLLGAGSSFSSGGWAPVTDAAHIRSSAGAANGLVLQASAGDMRFYVDGSPSERLRIDSDGCVRVGNTHSQTTSGNTKRIALGAKASIWGWASGQINGALTLADNYYWTGSNNVAIESDYSAYLSLRSGSLRYGSTDAANTGGANSSGITERFRLFKNELRHGSTNVLGGGLDDVRIRNSSSYKGTVLRGTGGSGGMANYDEYCFLLNRMGSDGDIVQFYAQGSKEGSISVSGSSVAYNGGVLTRWSQLVGISTNNKADRPTIYQGTVMSNLDEMCEWTGEENMQLNKTEVSTVSGDKNVAGVFWTWDDDDDTYVNDFYIAQTGDYIIRVGAATTVTRGDLLESAGDGTAKPQSDDIIRSKTVAKVTSGIAHTTYPDGTKTYPCVLMGS